MLHRDKWVHYYNLYANMLHRDTSKYTYNSCNMLHRDTSKYTTIIRL